MPLRDRASQIPLDPGIPEALARNREALTRRWLALLVERSPFEDLTERPLGERIRELDLFWEAAGRRVEAPQVHETAATGDGAEAGVGPSAPVTPLFPHK